MFPSSSQPTFRKKTGSAAAAFVVGIPLAICLLWAVYEGPLGHPLAKRYLQHPVEVAELILFSCALSFFGFKMWGIWRERHVCRQSLIPAWDGECLPPEEAATLLDRLARLPRHWKQTYLVCRIAAVLDFVHSRGSANDLDDQIRTLADNDALAVESSYSLTRFITWAIPILGFLGTVLGITDAISGVTPERLEKDLSQVTDGLALAFDTTALGLALTMVTMFVGFVVERSENRILEFVDTYVDRELAHRFERTGTEGGEFVAVVKQNTSILLRSVEQLVHRQAEIWSEAFQRVQNRLMKMEADLQKRLTEALSAALAHTLQTHAQNLAEAEERFRERLSPMMANVASLVDGLRLAAHEQQRALNPLLDAIAQQTDGLQAVHLETRQLVQHQQALNDHLANLVGTLHGCEWKVSSPEFRIRLEPHLPSSPKQAA
ncbi:MAG: biopolymer transporter [Gemmatales bacterium]|nr:MAG: biopolymer transporter [Gemmatales bacterium]